MKILTTNYLNQIHQFVFTFALAFFFLTLSVQFSAAQNNRWVYIGKNVSGVEYYLDKTSVERSGGEVRLWEKKIFKDGSYQINQSRWDCSEKIVLMVSSNIYTPQGKVIGKNFGNQWERIIPESIGEAIYQVVCNADTSQTAITEAMTENVQVISKLANIRELPSMNAAIVKKAAKGTVFRLVEAEPESGWYQIYLDSSDTAWIHGNTIEFIFLVPKNNGNKIKLPPSVLYDSEDGQN